MSRLWKAASVTLLAISLFAAMSLWAQAGPPEQGQGPGGGRGGHMGMMGPEDRADRMAKMLNLSDEQKSKVLDILKNEQKQMSVLRDDSSLTREARMDKGKEIHEGTNSQIRALLNSDQQKKFDEMQERMKNMGPRRGPDHPQSH